jgi:hypothetical protein
MKLQKGGEQRMEQAQVQGQQQVQKEFTGVMWCGVVERRNRRV